MLKIRMNTTVTKNTKQHIQYAFLLLNVQRLCYHCGATDERALIILIDGTTSIRLPPYPLLTQLMLKSLNFHFPSEQFLLGDSQFLIGLQNAPRQSR